jgi:hypothetical protein
LKLKNLPADIWSGKFRKILSELENHENHDLDKMSIEERESKFREKIVDVLNRVCEFSIQPGPHRRRKVSKKEKDLMSDKKTLGHMYRKDELDENEQFSLSHLKTQYMSEDEQIHSQKILINKCRSKIDYEIHKLRLKEKSDAIKTRCDEIVKDIEHKPNEAFKMIRHQKAYELINVLKDPAGVIHTDPEEVKKILREAWAPIFQANETNPVVEDDNNEGPYIDSEILRQITMRELRKIIKKLKKNKTAGMDIYPNEALQNMTEAEYSELLDLLNKIILEKELPSTWRKAQVTLIHKDGPKIDPMNYRPIALLSTSYAFESRLFQSSIIQLSVSNRNFLI